MNKRLFSLLAVVLTVVSVLAVPVAAQMNRTEYEGMEYFVGPASPGRQWISGDGVLQRQPFGAQAFESCENFDPLMITPRVQVAAPGFRQTKKNAMIFP